MLTLARQAAMIILGMLVTSSAFAEDCPSHRNQSDLVAKLTEAEEAFANFDALTFTTAMEELSLILPCLNEVVSSELAARVHRAEAIRLFAAGETEASLGSLRAAKHIEPTYEFPKGLFPEGYALLTEYEAIQQGEVEAKSVPWPRTGELHFNGIASRYRPVSHPTLFQHTAPPSGIASTAYLQPNQPIPTYDILPKARNRLIMSACVSAGAAGLSYGLGWSSNRRFHEDNSDLTRADLLSLQRNTNVAFGFTGGFAVLAVTGAVGAAMIGER